MSDLDDLDGPHGSVRLATWNVGEGMTADSGDGLQHLEDVIRSSDADIICLQEVPFGGTKAAFVRDLGARLDAAVVHTMVLHPSHLHLNGTSGLAIISRLPTSHYEERRFPAPSATVVGPDGTSWTMHDKGAQSVVVHTAAGDVRLVNLHHFPVHYFREALSKEHVGQLREAVAAWIADLDPFPAALAVCGDFNVDSAIEFLEGPGPVGAPTRLREALPGVPTTPRGQRQDHVVVSGGLVATGGAVVHTLTDHFLGVCDIRLPFGGVRRAGSAGRQTVHRQAAQ